MKKLSGGEGTKFVNVSLVGATRKWGILGADGEAKEVILCLLFFFLF